MIFAFVKSMLAYLPTDYQDVKTDLDNVIYGSGKQTETWEKCVSRTVGSIGFAAGGLFAERHFTESDKHEVRKF
jgi:predicted metalloendopeptidase